MAFDGIVTKAISSELSELSGARIDKIFQPNKNNILIGIYLNGKNYLLNICISSQNCRIHLTTHPNPNPQVAPNFCMVLRKNLIGLHLKNVFTLDLERVIILEFEGFDDVDDILNKKLIVELMGRHSNILLLNEQQIIIDSLRHIKQDNDNFRELLPHMKYTFPITEKLSFLEVHNFDQFYSLICSHHLVTSDAISISTLISSIFNGISKSFINTIIENLKQKNEPIYLFCNDLNLLDNDVRHFLEKIYMQIINIVNCLDNNNMLCFLTTDNIDTNKKDYYLTTNTCNSCSPYHLNFFIDDFYYQKETSENFKNYRNTLLKFILNILHKYDKRLLHIQTKLKECEHMDIYRLYGELITANLYQFDANKNFDQITVLNYYDNQKKLNIPLDNRFNLNTNAKRYFKKYNKLKNALDIVGKQKKETNEELDYIKSVVYELENASNIDELYEIFDEIAENPIFQNASGAMTLKTSSSFSSKKLKKSKLTSNKNVVFNPIKYVIDGYTVLVGRNNKENDHLTLKYAHKSDIWFHVKDFHGSHTILCLNNNTIANLPNSLLTKVAKIAVEHSKAKNSTNVPVDYCLVRYVKKPNGSKPGMVIYTDYHTIYV